MSTIDLQKLGLPQARMKEIIEEDYPAVSLKNRMRMIQQKFAERQIEEPKDIFGPPKNLTDVGFRFESVFNSLMGYMKQLLTSTDKVISVSEITQILQTYSQLASIYNSFVVNELPTNELFRRQIYEKLDMLASLAGKLYTDADNGIFRFSDPLTIQTLRQDIQEPNEFEQLRLRQQPILAPRLQALIEDLENKFMKAMEQIRRDALTRKLRLVDFSTDAPLPGQVRTYIREGDAPPPPPGENYPSRLPERFEARRLQQLQQQQQQQPVQQPIQQPVQQPQPRARAQRGQLSVDERRQQRLEAIERRRVDRQEARDEYLDASGNLTGLITDAMERLPMQERDLIVHYIRRRGYDPEQINLIPITELRAILNTIRDMVQQVEPQQQEQQRQEAVDELRELNRLIIEEVNRLPLQEQDLAVTYITLRGYDPQRLDLIPIPVLREILNNTREIAQQVRPQQQEQQEQQQQQDFEQMFQRQQQQQQPPPGNARARRAARRRQAQNIEV